MQDFCGTCGSPLKLESYIDLKVGQQLAQRTKERDLVERESAVRIFERASGYAKTFLIAAAVVVAPVAAVGSYKWSDLYSTIDSARANVQTASSEATTNVSNLRDSIELESASTKSELARIAASTQREGTKVVEAAKSARLAIANESSAVAEHVQAIGRQVEDASKLKPQLVSIQKELAKQQEVLSSTPKFVKSIFGMHRIEYFKTGLTGPERFQVLPRLKGSGATVYLLLSKPPIKETLQLQYHIYAQPPNSYVSVHNLVIFNWADSPSKFDTNQISVSYFPDDTDTDTVRSLSLKDGRIWADASPLPRLGEPDPAIVTTSAK